MNQEQIDRIPGLLNNLYTAVSELHALFGGKFRFTLDGHIVGDLGVAMACYLFDLTPLPNGTRGMDATTADGATVEVKLTQGDTGVGVYAHDPAGRPAFLVALRLPVDSPLEVVYAGDARRVWDRVPNLGMQNDGKQVDVRLSLLRRLHKDGVAAGTVLPQRSIPPGFRRRQG